MKAPLCGKNAILAACVVVVAASAFTPAAPANAEGHRRPDAQDTRIVPTTPVTSRASTAKDTTAPHQPTRAASGGTATVPVGATTVIGGITVTYKSSQGGAGTATAAGTAGARASQAAGLLKPVAATVTVQRAVSGGVSAKVSGTAASGTLTLKLKDVAPAAANAGDRVQVTAGACTTGLACTVVASTKDRAAGTVSFVAAPNTTYAIATAAAGGSTGDFSATSPSADSSWSANTQTGSFTWSYPVPVPPSASGQKPTLGISYDSGSVDGRTWATNNQPSWVGEGFNLAPGGSITREYKSCKDDKTGGTNASLTSYDLCWGTDNATISMAGKSGRLVKNATTGKWVLKSDDGSTIERFTGGGNGDNDGEYWVLTDTAGTKYYFGLEKRYTGDTGVRNSTLNVPVNGNHPGEPCYNATFANGFCTQAMRWNLSYVKDLRGNTLTYTYAKETNKYGQRNNAVAVTYDRASYLTMVEYGHGAGTEATTTAPQRVLFTVAERCLPSGGITCSDTDFTAANASYWPDVPFDQVCSGTTCTATQVAPTFFTRKRLTTIKTQVLKSGAYTDADAWTLTHAFPSPGDGTSAALSLTSIQHTGLVGGSLATPAVSFTYAQLANRVDGIDNADAFYKFRVNSVTTETGGVVSVNYAAADCSPTSLPTSLDNNTRRCFPAFFAAPGASTPTVHYFHKYVVDSVTADGRLAPSMPKVTRYTYVGSPAWHYDDNVGADAKYRTWSEFRGYATTETLSGDGTEPNPIKTRTTYFRGMHGDKLAAGGTKTVNVTDSQGGTTPDEDYYSGLVRETITYNGAAEVSGTITTPWASGARAADAFNTARIIRPEATVRSRVAREGNPAFVTQTSNTFDTNGWLTQTASEGDVSTPDDDTCVKNTYVSNPAANLIGLKATSTSYAVACTATPGAGDTIAQTVTYYDGASSETATPVRGETTTIKALTDTGLQTTKTIAYDAIGRPTSETDARGYATTTAYTPADRSPTTTVTVTNPLTHAVTTVVEPLTGKPSKVTDQNGKITTVTRDALGRVTKVWLPNRATFQTPSMEYTYTINAATGVNAITTQTLHYRLTTRLVKTDLFDGLTRPIQSQAQSKASDRVVTDVMYDSRGLKTVARGPWVSSGLPSTTAVTASDGAIDTVVKTAFDGAGRATSADTWILGVKKYTSTTTYRGDATDTEVPAGGIATRVVVNARGQATQKWQYHGNTITADKDVTSLEYNRKDQLTKLTDPFGNQWTYGYDQLGRQTTVNDPDKGALTNQYDLAGNLTRTTDARGQVIDRTYDQLGRPATIKTGAGATLVGYTYDTATNGKGRLATATSYYGGQGYESKVNAYDNFSNPTSTTLTIPASETGLAGSYTYTSNYNVDGSLGYVNMPAVANLPAEQYSYQRNETNQVIGMAAAGSIVPAASRDGFGRLTQYTWMNDTMGVTISQSYETGTGRLTNQRMDRDNLATPDYNATFSYDDAGNITSIADVPDPTNASRSDRQCFQYDWAGRLTEAWANGDAACSTSPSLGTTGAEPYWDSYTYDKNRRATETRRSGATTTTTAYTYPATGATAVRPHAVLSTSTSVNGGPAAVATLSYDNAGNTTGSALPAGGVGVFTWDELGRMATSVKSGDVAPTTHVYDAAGNLLIRKDPAGSKTLFLGDTEVTYTPAQGVTPAVTTAVRLFSFEGQVIAVRTAAGGAGVVFQPPTYQGTRVTQYSAGASPLVLRRFTPFGAPRTGTSASPAGWVGDHGFLGATGATTNPGTGVVQMGARQYDPVLGRFLSVDPVMDLGNPTQWNAYAYGNNSPVTFSDPTGLRPDYRDVDGGGGGYWSPEAPQAKYSTMDDYLSPFPSSPRNPRNPYYSQFVERSLGSATPRSSGGGAPARSSTSSYRGSGGGGYGVTQFLRSGQEYEAAKRVQQQQQQEARIAAEIAGERVWWQDPGVVFHGLLDGCGLVPVVGEACDGVNVAWYAFEGDYGNVALSATAMIPFVGWGATGVKGVKTGARAFHGAEPVVKGQAGEQAIRELVDIGEKRTVKVNGRDRVPDGINQEAVSEVKNVAKLSNTRQLRDYADYAAENKLRLDLYIRNDTKVSSMLQRLHEDPTSPVNLIRVLP